jgi:hypothetical protein
MMTEMHDVVEMLLNRMKDYPEDFVTEPDRYDIKPNKWQKALTMVQGVTSPQEREALDIRLEEAQRAVYMGAALKTILSDESEDDGVKLRANAHPTNTIGFGQAPIKTEGGLIGYENTDQYLKRRMHIELQKKQSEHALQNQIAANLRNQGLL